MSGLTEVNSSYDGDRRRVRVVEKENSVVQSDTKVIWCEDEICEERAADGVTVTRRPFTMGEHVAGVARFFGVDHLGSVGDVTDTTSALVSRYAFDPWGRRTLTAGTDVAPVGFTGHRWHAASGLSLTLYRGYDSELGRWISEDPAGMIDGPNRNAYVGNNPLNRVDPLGLQWSWLFPKTKKKLKDSIETLWTRCEQGKKLYHTETTFNPTNNREKWRAFFKEFDDECRKRASSGTTTVSYFRQSPGGFGGTGWGVGICCELPCQG